MSFGFLIEDIEFFCCFDFFVCVNMFIEGFESENLIMSGIFDLEI